MRQCDSDTFSLDNRGRDSPAKANEDEARREHSAAQIVLNDATPIKYTKFAFWVWVMPPLQKRGDRGAARR